MRVSVHCEYPAVYRTIIGLLSVCRGASLRVERGLSREKEDQVKASRRDVLCTRARRAGHRLPPPAGGDVCGAPHPGSGLGAGA